MTEERFSILDVSLLLSEGHGRCLSQEKKHSGSSWVLVVCMQMNCGWQSSVQISACLSSSQCACHQTLPFTYAHMQRGQDAEQQHLDCNGSWALMHTAGPLHLVVCENKSKHLPSFKH
jgi:hypothetical protein